MILSRNFWIIHLFALLHAAVAVGCRAAGIPDDLMLTLLTMLMVLVVCFSRRSGVIFMAVSLIAVNAIGFALGTGIASLVKLVTSSQFVIYPVSTFICTELIGWLVDRLALADSRRHADDRPSPSSLRWLLLAFVLVIVVRMLLVIKTSDFPGGGKNAVIGVILDYVSTCAALIWVAEYAIKYRAEADKAAEEANLAQYRYLKLKQQVNPHFLFNSLNILDCMIQEQSADEASRYTHKLAEIYRYLIKNEEETTVRLRDEMAFVQKYVDLLQVRFPEGLEVTTDIREADYSRSVVPCCVQLLIENATKHNAVNSADPLRISIASDGDTITVTNNIKPKLSSRPSESTGLGLKYIRQQYADIAGRSAVIEHTEDKYSVTLPLL